MRLFKKVEIERTIARLDLMAEVEKGFVAYSEGRSVVPPVGELLFDDPPGDVHIKYGYIRGEKYYVIKIASGFYDNPKLGLPSSDGLILLFDQKTGALEAIFHDEGLMTDVRTAVAGAIAARYLAPRSVERIGVFGTGIQARLQVLHLRSVTTCREVLVWGRSDGALESYRRDMEEEGFRVETTSTAHKVAGGANLIITATPSKEPLLRSADVPRGVHITAMGSDTPGKQEVDAAILGRADLVVVDSRSQCVERGESAHAIAGGILGTDALCELGDVIRGSAPARTSDEELTVADLTGVAVQDMAIAKAVFERA